MALAVASTRLVAQEAGGPPATLRATNAPATPFAGLSAQYEAVGRYPELARAGSPFNTEFLVRMRNYQTVNKTFFQNERWPVLLAQEVAAAGLPSVAAIVEPRSPSLPAGSVAVLPHIDRNAGGIVADPADAPSPVQWAIAAGDQLQTKPYKWGGGHGCLEDSGYDCSGSVSYVLRKAGLLGQSLTSSSFASYGIPGPGRWITIYAGPGHAFMTVCGRRLDTTGGGSRGDSGPRWRSEPRYAAGFTMRHPPGL